MVRTVLAGALVSVLATAPVLPAEDGPRSAAVRTDRHLRASLSYSAPVAGAVVRRFVPPQSRFGAGHRGVDLATAPAEPVHAAADGVVSFAGVLAGRGVIVISHPDGVRTEYEPVRVVVRVGARVRRGSEVGYVRGTHGACAPDRCVHWSARRGETYLDPLSLLGGLGVVHLVPWGRAP